MVEMYFVRRRNIDQLDLWIGTEVVYRFVSPASEFPEESLSRYLPRFGGCDKSNPRVFDKGCPAQDERPSQACDADAHR